MSSRTEVRLSEGGSGLAIWFATHVEYEQVLKAFKVAGWAVKGYPIVPGLFVAASTPDQCEALAAWCAEWKAAYKLPF